MADNTKNKVEVSENEQQTTQTVVEKTSKKQVKNKKAKENKPNIFKRTGKKLKQTGSELKKVSWPTFGKVLKQTGVVIAIVLIFAVVLLGIDKLLELLFGLLIK